MSQATQVFNGAMFITNPFVSNSFIRVDVLEQRFGEMIEDASDRASSGCGLHFELYEVRVLDSLRARAATLQFPHDALFKREAERRGFQLDEKHYLTAQEAASQLMEEINEEML